MNVTVLSFFFLPEYSGGALQMANLMKGMQRCQEINFRVIAARLNPEWPTKETIDGVNVTRVNVRHNDDLLNFWLHASAELWKTRTTTDLVQANGLKPAHGFPLWIAHRLGKPTIGRLSIAESDLSFSTQGRLIGRFHKWCLKRVDKYVAISSALMREVGDVGLSMNKCVYLYNGVDMDVYRPASEKEKKAVKMNLGLGDETIVLFVGVMDERKGVDVLIRAFQRIAAVQESVRLVLVGPTNRDDRGEAYVKRLKMMAHELGILEKVSFRDYTEDVTQYYHTADLFVLPSRKEGMPNVVLEAMACRLPIVGTRISGTEDLIESGKNGLLVCSGDETELADAIIKLIDDPDKRREMGERGMERVKNHHDMGLISRSYVNLYRELLS